MKQFILMGLMAFTQTVLAQDAKVVTFPAFSVGECLLALFADDGSVHHEIVKIDEIGNSEQAKKGQTVCDEKTAKTYRNKSGSCYVFCNPNQK